MRHYSLVISDYLVDADVLLLRLDHPHALFAHLVHYAKYVDRVHVRYLKGEQNGLFKTDLKYISRIILDFENVAVARRKMREEKEHIIQYSAESSSLLMMSPPLFQLSFKDHGGRRFYDPPSCFSTFMKFG